MIQVNNKISLKGEYRIIRYNSMGQVNLDTGWRKNLITDIGMTAKARSQQQSWATHIYIGSGTTAPHPFDSQMETFLASSNTTAATTTRNSVPTAPDYEKWNQFSKRFAAGVGTGTINEVGFGNDSDHVGNTYARQLVSPGIVKAANQVLDIYWRVTQYQDLTDVVDTVVIDGITYDIVTRPYNVALHQDSTGTLGVIGTDLWTAYQVSDQPLVAITATSLAAATASGESTDSRVNTTGGGSGGVGFQEISYKYGLDSGNLANGIRTISCGHTGAAAKIQTQFTAQTPTSAANPLCIPKDSTKELTINWRTDWVRHP